MVRFPIHFNDQARLRCHEMDCTGRTGTSPPPVATELRFSPSTVIAMVPAHLSSMRSPRHLLNERSNCSSCFRLVVASLTAMTGARSVATVLVSHAQARVNLLDDQQVLFSLDKLSF